MVSALKGNGHLFVLFVILSTKELFDRRRRRASFAIAFLVRPETPILLSLIQKVRSK
jgi:hypothetical protein